MEKKNTTHRAEESRRKKLIRELVNEDNEELNDEELVQLLLSKTMSLKLKDNDKPGFGQRAADVMAQFAGSWAFILCFLAGMISWMGVNVFLGKAAFDAFPFILLNLVLSCVAAVQAPLIMMSQNRQEAKDRERAESDYMINLKSEFIVADLHSKLEQLLREQKHLQTEMQRMAAELAAFRAQGESGNTGGSVAQGESDNTGRNRAQGELDNAGGSIAQGESDNTGGNRAQGE